MSDLQPDDWPHLATAFDGLRNTTVDDSQGVEILSRVYAAVQAWARANNRPSIPQGAFTRILVHAGFPCAKRRVFGDGRRTNIVFRLRLLEGDGRPADLSH